MPLSAVHGRLAEGMSHALGLRGATPRSSSCWHTGYRGTRPSRSSQDTLCPRFSGSNIPPSGCDI